MVVRAVVKEGVGVRQASRIFKLSPNTVIAWVREFSKKKNLRNEIHDNPVVGLDEMWSFVRKKENEIWIWLALEVNSRKILSYAVGDRSVYTFKKLWDRIDDKIKRCNISHRSLGRLQSNPLQAKNHKKRWN